MAQKIKYLSEITKPLIKLLTVIPEARIILQNTTKNDIEYHINPDAELDYITIVFYDTIMIDSNGIYVNRQSKESTKIFLFMNGFNSLHKLSKNIDYDEKLYNKFMKINQNNESEEKSNDET